MTNRAVTPGVSTDYHVMNDAGERSTVTQEGIGALVMASVGTCLRTILHLSDGSLSATQARVSLVSIGVVPWVCAHDCLCRLGLDMCMMWCMP